MISLQVMAGAQSRPADLVIINANIRTMTTPDARAQALAVSGNRISSVGTNKQIKRLIGPATRVIDAQGRLVLPGFNDAHVHFLGVGNTFSSIDLRYVSSGREMIDRVVRYTRFLPRGRWILGGQWKNPNWVLPDRRSVDTVTPGNPVFLYHADGRSAFANSLSFQLAGVKADVPDVELDSSGVPTGVVRGAALARIAAAVPSNHSRRWPEIAETATNYAASLGVTSVQDMHSDDSREIYLELQRQGKLKTRVYDCISLPDWKKLVGSTQPSKDGGEMVRGGCLKSFSNGDEESMPKLLSDVLAADKAALQIMIHAIGNSANDIVLTVFEQAAKSNGPRDRRFRVEHANNPRVTDLHRFARSNIVASMQPSLFDGGNGGHYRTLLKQGAAVAFGSDAAMIDLDPLHGIQAAVNAGDEAVSVYDAVRAYTAGSAYAEFQEKHKGAIEPGKLADFVILSEDIFVVDPAKIDTASAVMTVVNGVVVFEPETFRSR